ncbi:indole-3-glycerol phosphate synthase TrpC [Caldilinea sp.]|jgi:indole-3-glycerol phosphate synthase|uniref:indole-3-glycerol phosphate synthase TrpC n=1 Tax=Caldilinea sp. TaxID=2293560 RepID=UPI002612E16C|nr:indole-3-glycerol phosphate synthase TrpC [Caldilinea sp.]
MPKVKPSKLDIAKHQGEVLNLIMAWKRQEVPRQMEIAPLAQVKAFARLAPPALDFAAALTAEPGASLIAEVKRASPSKGVIAREWDPEQIAETYARNGAAAISCLTDSRFFQGKLEYLTAIKERLREIGRAAPVLRKDFIYHEYQVYEARMAGADAILLIVGVLGDNDLRELRELAESLGMAALVEVHDEAETERALKSGARIIGVNNRDLRTFQVDIETTGRLRKLIPPDKILVGESGIRTPEDVQRMAAMGCDAILVGETFCKLPQAQRAAKVKEFVEAGRRSRRA